MSGTFGTDRACRINSNLCTVTVCLLQIYCICSFVILYHYEFVARVYPVLVRRQDLKHKNEISNVSPWNINFRISFPLQSYPVFLAREKLLS